MIILEKLNFITRPDCPACGAGNVPVVLSIPFSDERIFRFLEVYYKGRISLSQLSGAEFRVSRCDICSLHYQVDILDSPSMDYLYEHVVSAEESKAKREGASLKYFELLLDDASYISKLIDVGKPRQTKVLDFGMGWGHWVAAARALGYNAIGAELSPLRIAFAASNGISAINIDAALPQSFDYVHSNQVFEHLADPHGVLTRLSQLMKPGAVIMIKVPDGSNSHRKLSGKWSAAKDELHPLEHINTFTYGSLVKLAVRSGLTPVQAAEFKTLFSWLRFAVTRFRRPQAPFAFFRKPLK